MKHTSICAILASLLLQNAASAASAYRSVNTKPSSVQEQVARYNHATDLGSDFLKGIRISGILDLSSLKNADTIGHEFLKDKITLTGIILPEKVKTIGYNFLRGCCALREIDLTPLKSLISIEFGFLEGCANLTKVDLSVFENLTSIGSNFLKECRALTEIDLTLLKSLISIESCFLMGCANLKKVNLFAFENITSIGPCFLADCKKLTEIDLTPLKSLISIGYNFLSGCSALTEIDLTPLKSVTGIGPCFLGGCTNLKKVILPDHQAFNDVEFPSSVTIISGFAMIMNDGTFKMQDPRVNSILSITCEERVFHAVNINLQVLSDTREICSRFLAGFARLHNVDLSPLEKVERIDDGFLSGCRSIENLAI